MFSTILMFLCTLVMLKQATPQDYCLDSDNKVRLQQVSTFGDNAVCSGYPLNVEEGDRLCGWLDGAGAETFCWENQPNEDEIHDYRTRNFRCIPERVQGDGLDTTAGAYIPVNGGVTDFECESGSDRCFLECKDGGAAIVVNDVAACQGNPFDMAVACVDVDECRDGAIRSCTGPSHARDCDIGPACGPNTKCNNTIGDYTCECIHAGFKEETNYDAYIIDVGCIDIDECATAACPAPHRCHNTIGSYYCECAYGYEWNEIVPECVLRTCGEPEDILYAFLNPPLAPNDFRDERTYTCEEGFEPSYRGGDVFTLSCRPDGQWCHCQPPACRRKSCGIPHYDGNAWTDSIPGVFGDMLRYNCADGFDADGNSYYEIECLDTGLWEEPGDKCEDTDECEQAGVCPDSAKCVNTVGSFHCLCKLGYEETLPQGAECDEISCGAIPVVAHGHRLTDSNPDDDKFGMTIKYSCDAGYRVSTRNIPTRPLLEFEITCTLDGTWNPFPVPECLPVSCGDPDFLANSFRVGPFFYYERQVTYTCLDGFRPADNNGLLSTSSFSIQCQANGKWTQKTHCININECKEKQYPCGFLEGQYCVDTIGDYTCNCPPGFRLDRTGRGCEELPEEDTPSHPGSMCDPFKLLGICNMGNCIYDNVELPVCLCDPGFKGAFCDKRIRPLFTTPYILNLSSIALGSIVLIVCIALMCYVCCKHLCQENHHHHDQHLVYGTGRRVVPRRFPLRMGHMMGPGWGRGSHFHGRS